MLPGHVLFIIPNMAKLLIAIGILLIITGVIMWAWPHIPFLGRLPGDITIKSKNVTIYFPIVTSIIISIILTILLNLFFRK